MPDSSAVLLKREEIESVPATAGGPPSKDAAAKTLFDFTHKVFSLPGACFRLDTDAREPVFRVQLGDINVGIPIGTLSREFGIDPESRDAQLIALTRKGLRFVTEIRPMDLIPREMLDGTASWPVEERHRAFAKAKLMKQIAEWFATDSGGSGGIEKLLGTADETDAVREQIQAVFARIAEKLGLGAEHRQQVVDYLDTLGRELSYIEAQREHVARLPQVKRKLLDLARVYARERAMVEELLRIAGLLQTPMAEFAETFHQIDAQTGEILALLRNIQAQLDFIRTTRDDLHFRLMPWGNLLQIWQAIPLERSRDTETKTRVLYHFLASHYAPKNVWR